MTNITYSPGPWFTESEPYDSYYQISDDLGTSLAQVEAWDGDKDEEVMREAKANARLIAAAPELLEALIECEDYLISAGMEHDLTCKKARAAIAKARAAGTCTADDGSLPTRFDEYEVHGMKRLPAIHGLEEEPVGRVIDNCEQVPDDEAEFWSLFGHNPGQGLDCIGDFKTRDHAEEIYARITGHRYGRRP
jgi:hypothetical protein